MEQSQFNQRVFLQFSPSTRQFPKPKPINIFEQQQQPIIFPKPKPFIIFEQEPEPIIFPVVDDGVYQPKTNKTRAAYDRLLILIYQPHPGQPLFDQPLSVIRFVADKILQILKNDAVGYRDKKRNIEMILDPIPNDVFEKLVEIGEVITDFYEFADGSHVDGGVVDGVRNLSIGSKNDGIVDGVRDLYICRNK